MISPRQIISGSTVAIFANSPRSSLWHSETECDIATSMCALTAQNDDCISRENFVKFGPVTPELTELICDRQIRHCQKTGVFCGISPDVVDRFLQSFHHMTALYVQTMDLYQIFQFLNGRCHGNQIILP